MTAPNTNWHVIVAAVVVTIVDVVMILVLGATKENLSTIGIVDGVLLGLLAHSGLLQAADAQRVEKIAESVSPQIANAVGAVEKNLTDLHTVSTANVAALHTAVAVQAAKTGFSVPPLVVPKASDPIVDDQRVSQVQNKPVKL
jgi:hypothetical protein